jgi:hypothetical protein
MRIRSEVVTLDEQMLDQVEQAFRAAQVWTDPEFKVRQRYKLVNKKPVAQGPRTELPPDPFSIYAAIPEPPEGEDAYSRTYKIAGECLANHARSNGASGHELVRLRLERADFDGQPGIRVYAEKVDA